MLTFWFNVALATRAEAMNWLHFANFLHEYLCKLRSRSVSRSSSFNRLSSVNDDAVLNYVETVLCFLSMLARTSSCTT